MHAALLGLLFFSSGTAGDVVARLRRLQDHGLSASVRYVVVSNGSCAQHGPSGVDMRPHLPVPEGHSCSNVVDIHDCEQIGRKLSISNGGANGGKLQMGSSQRLKSAYGCVQKGGGHEVTDPPKTSNLKFNPAAGSPVSSPSFYRTRPLTLQLTNARMAGAVQFELVVCMQLQTLIPGSSVATSS